MRRALRVALLLAVGAACLPARPASGGVVEATVQDDKGKPVEDAVVYVAPGAGVPAARAAGTATMDQWKQEFIPHVLAIEVGTAVNFPNKDNIRHHVYSFSSPKKFELPLYIGTPAAPVVFDKPGVVVLGCNIHDWMVAYVYILPTPHFARTGADGRARIEDVPAGAHEIRVWHPRLREATEKTGRGVSVGPAPGAAAFAIGLKREWRIPRPAGSRYERID
jgi:plastocyanin